MRALNRNVRSVYQALKNHSHSTQLFTNSDRAHMERALERLGIDEAVFDAVVCFETMNPHLFGEARADGGGDQQPVVVLKPSVDAIVAGLRAAGTNPRRTVGPTQHTYLPFSSLSFHL
jgi:FMN phosphatase YigB (HAD superfamily)